MSPSFWFWLVAAVVMAIIEGVTPALVTIWFMFGALAAMIPAAFTNLSFPIQFAIFAVVSALLLVITRPFLKKFSKRADSQKTNADRIIGQEAIVTEEIVNIENKGQITVLGQVWSAKSEDGSNISKGEIVKVSDIKGVKAVVKK